MPGTQRSKRSLQVAILSALVFGLVAGESTAQQTQASIIGQVSDSDGGVLPGVMITATSPSLQVPNISDVTNERGEYRLGQLPIGVYSVTYVLPGFQTYRRDGLRLTAGFVAREDVVLRIGGVEESVTVSGASPVVDTTSTAIASQFTREVLDLAATSRTGIFSVVSQMPGVRATTIDFGGNTVTETPVTIAYGVLGQAWITMEGISVQKPYSQNQGGNYFDYSSLEEVRSEIVGSDASWPRSGMKMAIITKSGGNDFHGSYFTSYADGSFESSNLSPERRAELGITQAPELVRRSDFSGDLGGRLIRDKLWFYGALRRQGQIQIPLDGFMPDGSPAEELAQTTFQTAKLSYQANPTNRFVYFGTWAQKDETAGTGPFVPWESRTTGVVPTVTSKGEWQMTLGNSMVTTLQYGYWRYFFPRDNTAPGKIPTDDIGTQFTTGNCSGCNVRSVNWRHHPRGTFSWYRPNLFMGNHEFKAGFDYWRTFDARELVDRRGDGNLRLRFNRGVPFQIQTVNAPALPKNPTHNLGVYVADSWNVSRRLTLNLGIRFSRDNGFVPAQCLSAGEFSQAACYPRIQFPVWNTLAPRLGLAYDLSGNGKTVLKTSWNRYPHMRGSDEITPANRVSGTTTTWRWNDANGNRTYDPGEVNLDPTQSDFVSISGVTNMVPNPDERQPKTDEFLVAVDREIMPNFAIRAAGIYHRYFDKVRLRNNRRPYDVYSIPITNRDPGEDGIAGTGDDPGTFITYWDYPAAYQGIQFVETSYVNDPDATETYKSFELSATKRLTGNWQFAASYSATKKNIPYVINSGGTNNYPTSSVDPNAEINATDRTWMWQGQVSGSYNLPFDVLASVNYQHRSGEAFARTVLFTGGVRIPSIVLRVEPIGSRRLDSINVTDMKVQKTFRVKGNTRLSAMVNLYNVFNAATVVAVTDRSGANFMQPSGSFNSITPPRIFSFSFSFSF